MLCPHWIHREIRNIYEALHVACLYTAHDFVSFVSNFCAIKPLNSFIPFPRRPPTVFMLRKSSYLEMEGIHFPRSGKDVIAEHEPLCGGGLARA